MGRDKKGRYNTYNVKRSDHSGVCNLDLPSELYRGTLPQTRASLARARRETQPGRERHQPEAAMGHCRSSHSRAPNTPTGRRLTLAGRKGHQTTDNRSARTCDIYGARTMRTIIQEIHATPLRIHSPRLYQRNHRAGSGTIPNYDDSVRYRMISREIFGKVPYPRGTIR